MSTAVFIRRMLEAGFSHDDALRAAEVFEATAVPAAPQRSKGAIRQARYEERKRQEASENVRSDANDGSDASPLPLPPSPQTPQPPTPTPGESSIARKGPSRSDVARGFLGFWAAYPRRVGKDAAAKAFTKAMARIDDPDPLATILAGIERALPGWDDPQFIPHPASWLNAGRWNDEAPTPRTEIRNDRPNTRSDARSAWADIIADSRSEGAGPPEPLRLAG